MKPLFTVLSLAGLLLPAAASAQQWRLDVVGAGTLTHMANRSTVRSNVYQPLYVGSGLKSKAAYQVGLRISTPLRENLALEAEPRYSRVRGSFDYRFSQSEATVGVGGGLAGGYWQLPLGLRYTLSRSAQRPQLLVRVVPGYGALHPVDPVGGVPNNYAGFYRPPTPTKIALGYATRPAHWQLGLEAGVGIDVLRRLNLGLLLYHGLTPAQVLSTRGSAEYFEEATRQQKSYTISGQVRARLTTLSLQAAVRLH
ncbi:hypothetical protein EJV47_05250 [Hymenobacter gummosus]|uniref:Outer membrane protein beta-barrel domain-containing protein n=1 Tax=Hymenobacter gummosus TaxID=1776032 RepID=A0A431U836_9BACT|nr:hypothetical protein [Hymenobacter gummosus]RTQ52421.1 hypothetical protein EJV47_05250 [Hymenobacter gummosus]